MTITCARANCPLRQLPESARGPITYVSLVCAPGAGRHQADSGWAHPDCAEQVALSLIGTAGHIPRSREVMVAFDPSEREVSDTLTAAHYYCGHPGCLVVVLERYGSPMVKHLLYQAASHPDRALGAIPPLGADARSQLEAAINERGRRASAPAGRRRPTAAPVEDAPDERGLPLPALTDSRRPGSMNVLVVGAGAVGTLVASKLLLAGNEVVVLEQAARTGVIRSSGFHLRERGHTHAVRPAAVVSSLSEAFPSGVEYDLFVLATKAYDAQAVLEQIASAGLTLPRKVMTLQNGVGVEEVAAKLLGERRVLAASLTIPVSSTTIGHAQVEHRGRGLALAPLHGDESIDEWVALFRTAGIDTRAFKDYRAIKWSKLFLNIVGNATCAILNRKPAVIYGHRRTFMLERAMLKETLAVMKAMGVPVVNLPGSPARSLAWGISYLPASLARSLLTPSINRGRGEKMPSLYLDLAAGRKKSEVVFLNGAVVRHGRELGVPTPVNFALTDTLHQLFNGLLRWGDFHGKPSALWARVPSE